MFKKTERLSRSEFSQHFKVGKKHQFKYLTIITDKTDSTKVAVVVGKKVAKSAVKRNKIKRRIYASLRKQFSEKKGVGVVVVIVKPAYASLPRKAADIFLIESIAQVAKGA